MVGVWEFQKGGGRVGAARASVGETQGCGLAEACGRPTSGYPTFLLPELGWLRAAAVQEGVPGGRGQE